MNYAIKLLKLTGFKTYIAAIGSIAFGVYQITEGNIDEGVKLIIAGFGAFGFRAALEKQV